MGYAQPGTSPLELLELAKLAEALGYDSAWAAEAWGVDAITPLAWLGAQTTTLKLGTAIMQLPGRSPANAAMTAVTLDMLSGGRFLMGLGTSGPQVVEGWHGQEWGKPLGKTREYVDIVRAILRRERLEHHGEHYDIPVQGGTGLGKPLKLMARPLRSDIPIYLAAIAPKAVEQAFEIADGWLPIFWSPEQARDVFPLDRAREGFDIAPSVPALLIDDVQAGRDVMKEYYSFYIGGMGARGQELLQRPVHALRLRVGGEGDPGALPRRAAARGGGQGAGRVRRRGRADRPARADPRPSGRVARERRDDAARLDARRGDAAGRRRCRLVTLAVASAGSERMERHVEDRKAAGRAASPRRGQRRPDPSCAQAPERAASANRASMPPRGRGRSNVTTGASPQRRKRLLLRPVQPIVSSAVCASNGTATSKIAARVSSAPSSPRMKRP